MPQKKIKDTGHMKLYLIQRDEDEPVYDVYNGFVIASGNSRGVRTLASTSAGDEGQEVWLDKTRSTVTLLSNEIAKKSPIYVPCIILSDFTAG